MILRGRSVVPGRGDGTALVSPAPFSFVGGVDPTTGEILDPDAGRGERLASRIFAFPHGKGSTVGAYVLYGLAKRGTGPAAIVNAATDGIIAVGATLGGIPLVDGVDTACLRTGDRLIVDANRGRIELPDVRGTPVVTAILQNRGQILILRRSDAVGTFRGRWSAVSGYLEGREDPKVRALREVREETGISRPRFRAAGPPIHARADTTIFVVHPFLFDVPKRKVRLDWENVEYRWIHPGELDRFETVPRLGDVVAAVRSKQDRGR